MANKRSFCYIDDLISGIKIIFSNKNLEMPMFSNPDEYEIREILIW